MSLAPAPAAHPQPLPSRPGLVPPRTKAPNTRGIWIGVIVALLITGGIGLFQWARRGSRPSPAATNSIRSAPVTTGTVVNTIRISGVTAAASYVSLITPQLRGSRTDGLRNSAAGASASTSSGTTASTASKTGSDSSVASSAPGGSSAFQSATKRFGSTLRGSSSSASGSAGANTPAPSTAMGPNGIGTAADSLPGGGGGGGGGNGPGDFMLVLQKVVPPGSHVKKGQMIAEFDRQYMMLRLDDYRASVAQANSSFTKQKAELEITRKAHEQLIASAKADLEKAKLDLKTVPVLSAIDAERAKLAMDQADAKYKQLLAEVKFVEASQAAEIRKSELALQQSQLELKRAELNADRMTCYGADRWFGRHAEHVPGRRVRSNPAGRSALAGHVFYAGGQPVVHGDQLHRQSGGCRQAACRQ